MSATILANATWLDGHAVNNHRLAGILTLVVLVGIGTVCGVALLKSRQNSRELSVRVKRTVLLLAVLGFAATAWTAYLGGTLRHSELAGDPPRSGSAWRQMIHHLSV
jgi:hypothetical protein